MSESNMQYVTSTSFLLLTYAKYLTSARTVAYCGGSVVTPARLRSIAKNQVHLKINVLNTTWLYNIVAFAHYNQLIKLKPKPSAVFQKSIRIGQYLFIT